MIGVFKRKDIDNLWGIVAHCIASLTLSANSSARSRRDGFHCDAKRLVLQKTLLHQQCENLNKTFSLFQQSFNFVISKNNNSLSGPVFPRKLWWNTGSDDSVVILPVLLALFASVQCNEVCVVQRSESNSATSWDGSMMTTLRLETILT